MYQNLYVELWGARTIVCLTLLTGLLVGCATDGPNHVVKVGSSATQTYEVENYQDNEPGSRIGATNIDPVIKYGSTKLLNSPQKRVFSAKAGQFSLDFVNIAVEDFISVVFTEMLGKSYSLDNAIKGNVTVQSRGQINEVQLLSMVESVLATKSAVLIARADHYDLVPLNKAKSYSFKPELYSARRAKPGYRMVVVPVNYVNPEDLKSILESVAPAVGHLKIDKERKAIVVTGTELEIANIVDAVQIFDVNWLESKSIALLPVENTQASVIKAELDKILSNQNKSHEIVIDTFDRFNALLIVAGHKNEIDAVRTWLEILDVRIPTVDTQLYVYDVQNRKASELTEMLNGIFNEDGEVSSTGLSGKDDNKTASTEEVVLTNKRGSAKPATVKESTTDTMRFVADETNNAIIILAKEAEYEKIRTVIKDLDVIPLQVLIEVSIIEVTLTDELSYGVEWFLKHNGIQNTYDSETSLDLNAGAGLGPIVPGLSFVLSGSESLVQAVFNTLASESKLNVLSSPSLMALDNHSATIRVGDQQPVQVASTKSTNNDVLTQSIEFKNTGVLLSVTPRVNSGGLVTMELSQEVTDVGSIDDATGQRSFLQRNINSTVAVQDGRTIILGGLITENVVDTVSGVPGLYKIPVIGALFRKTTKSTVKRELIVLITPKVVFNHQNATKITQEYAEKMQLLKSSVEIQ